MRSRADLAQRIDHTLLKPEATEANVVAAVTEAIELNTLAVCVSPSMVSLAHKVIGSSGGPLIATVAGFPSGKHVAEVKADESARAVEAGAAEVDMVIDVGAALAGDYAAVAAEIAAVRTAVGDAMLKVIVESAALLSLGGDETLVDVCAVAERAGADFVKTSTGFHPSGGASVHAVELMAATVGGRLGIKASGGIRTAADAIAMLDAGATRLGLSSSRAVLDGL